MLNLGIVDLAVLLLYLLSAVVIGLILSGRAKSLESYVLGDRNLPWWAILGSIVATETSTATVLSVPGEAYGPTGMRFLQLAIGYIFGRIVIVKMLLPLFFQGKLFTAYQVLEKRFGTATKLSSSFLFLITRNLGDGLRLFLAAIVLQKLANIPFAWSVIVMGGVTILYTFFGGMRSVVWNDCVQFVVYIIGGIAALFIILHHIPGGWQELVEYGNTHDKFRVFEWTWSLRETYTFWSGLIGGAVLTIGTHGTDHMMVQRYLSARSQADAGRAIVVSAFVVFAQFALFLLIGVGLACYYSHFPEKTFEKADEVFADFIVNVFPRNTGLIGLMLAAVLAAAMSTLSSSLNSSASALVNDFYVTWRRKPASPAHLFTMTRAMTVVFGLIQIAIGIWARQFGATVVSNVLTIAGFSAGLLLGIFALGVLTDKVGQAAALVGAAAALGVLIFVQFGLPHFMLADSFPWLQPTADPKLALKVAMPWLALIGASTTFAIGWLAAQFLPRKGIQT